MRKPTGKFFYDHKKIPFPIDCEGVPAYMESLGKKNVNSYEEYLNDLNNYSYFMQGHGPNYALKIGRVSQTEDELVKNVKEGAVSLLAHMLHSGELDIDNVRRISLKTYNSPSLPIYSHLTGNEVMVMKKSKKGEKLSTETITVKKEKVQERKPSVDNIKETKEKVAERKSSKTLEVAEKKEKKEKKKEEKKEEKIEKKD